MRAKATRQHKTQSTWRPNQWYETLVRIRDDQPRRFDKFSDGLKHQVEEYARQRVLTEQKAA